jgi:hypothetical protein
MEKKLVLVSVLLIFCSKVFCQDLVGRKIINGSINTTLVFQNNNYYSNFADVNVFLLYGKIKEDNTYWSFGGSLNVSSANNNESSSTMIGPSFERGKFVKIIDKLYLAPYLGGTVQAIIGTNGRTDSNGINLEFYASPLRFMYQLNDKFLLTAGFGRAEVGLNAKGSTTVISLNGSLNNNSGFGVFYTFK